MGHSVHPKLIEVKNIFHLVLSSRYKTMLGIGSWAHRATSRTGHNTRPPARHSCCLAAGQWLSPTTGRAGSRVGQGMGDWPLGLPQLAAGRRFQQGRGSVWGPRLVHLRTVHSRILLGSMADYLSCIKPKNSRASHPLNSSITP